MMTNEDEPEGIDITRKEVFGEILKELGMLIDATRPEGELPSAEEQRVKALLEQAKIANEQSED